MPLLDISQVTQTLLDTIRLAVTNSPSWNPMNLLNVSPLPPDKLSGENTVSFYLYHAMEEVQNRNTYVPGISDIPVRYLPLELHLYYLLTAHSDLEAENATIREQLMMGLSMKALHDYPQIVDETTIDGTQPMPLSLQGNNNCFRITLMPVSAADAVDYWTAGSSPLRLSAYYQVSVIQLEPETPQIRPGRVLTYNIFTLPGENPRVDTTVNIITFTIPGETTSRSLELRPAQVTYDESFNVIGTNFYGDDLRLLLRQSTWDAPVEADISWSVTAGATSIQAIVRQTASGIDILPGMYTASVQVFRTHTAPSGEHVMSVTSNETPFVITPRINSITNPDAQGQFTVTGSIFQHPDIAPEMIQIFVGTNRLAVGTAGGLQFGEYAIIDSTTLDIRLPSGLASGSSVSFRMMINGAETAPVWVTVA